MKTTFKSKEGILADINLLDHALINGYQIDKEKSTKVWMKLKSTVTGDNIMINTLKNLYYNLDYDTDKGDVIQFVANRLNGSLCVDKSNEAFYAALVNINKGFGNYLKEDNKNLIANKNSFIEKEYIIITTLIFSSLIIFILSFNIENYHSDKIQEYKTIKGHMAYQPEIDFSGKRKNRKEYLIFKLKEYPQIKFNLQYENFNKINGYEFVKTNHQNNLIEFEIFKEDNDYNIKKLVQPYFYSHLNNKKIISIQALKYQNKELIKIDFSNKFQGRFDLLLMFGGVLFIVLITYNIYCITRILK